MLSDLQNVWWGGRDSNSRPRDYVEVDDTCFRIPDQHETMLAVVPRTNTEEVTRFKAYGHRTGSAEKVSKLI